MGFTASAGGSPIDRVALPGRYVVLEHLANGGMSSVWCARDELLGRTVAIKLLADGYAQDQTAVRRFEREARAAARVCSHPNVATVYDIGVAPAAGAGGTDRAGLGAPFIVIEYLPGGSVATALQRAGGQGLDPQLVARWIGQAAEALDYAHSLDVVHRDVKPGNLLLDSSGRVRVADFGIARLMTEATITNIGEVLGTAAYLSPEQALGDATTAASDRYSLAVTAYEMLTGARPFEAEAVLARRAGPGADPVRASARNPALPKAVDAVLARGFAIDPARRFASAEEFAGALGRALARPARAAEPLRFSEAAAAYAPFVSYGTRRRVPGARTAALAALAAVALAAGVATGASSSSGSRSGGPAAAAAARARRHRRSSAARTTVAAITPRKPTSPTTSTATAASPPPAPNPLTLDTQGHEMMVQGNYAGAIAAMRQVLAETAPNTLLHAYALFDLGRSLRLAGDPQAAIPILEQRLQYPNQTPVVEIELKLAEQAAGVLGPGAGDGHGRGHPAHDAGPRPGGPGSGGNQGAGPGGNQGAGPGGPGD
jgi:tetratricopeptide (TPR) repeat protein